MGRTGGVIQEPLLFIEASIMQPSGQTKVMTGRGQWTYAPKADDGWSTPDFDASAWSAVADSKPADPAETAYVFRRPDRAFPSYDGSIPIPAWQGLIQLHHGGDAHELTFRSDREAVVHMTVPKFDTFDSPYAEFSLHRTRDDGSNGEVVLAGRVRKAEVRKDAGTVVFPLTLGRLTGGVYALSTRLCSADGTVLETRPHEPVLVVSHIEQPPMSGTDCYDALTLDASDRLVIDFTDRSKQCGPDWIETMVGFRREPSRTVAGCRRLGRGEHQGA